jgi:tetratricopeptide (TPR) repeat protein
MVTAGAMGGMVVTGGLAVYANGQRIEANAQRMVAEKEAKAARAASDYLVNTFEVSNPATENPRTITALTILSRSAERAHAELAGEPAIQARLLATLGRAYNNLGLLKEAQAAFESSLPAVRKAGPDGADALLELAETYTRQGALDQATNTVAEAERLLGPDTKQHRQQRGRAAMARGRILTLASEVTPGLAAFETAQRLLESDNEAPPDLLATVYTNHGALLSDAGQFAKANLALSKALAIRRRTLGEIHFKTSSAWQALAQNSYLSATAQTPFNRAQLKTAEIQIANALKIQQKVLEGDNPILADALSMQGQIFADQGKLPQAERTLREAIAMYRRAFGGPHSKIGIAEIYLAQIQSDQNNPKAALETLADAKHNYDVSYGKIHPNHGDLLIYRATILAKTGRLAEARADCAEGMGILRATLGADASFTKTNEAKCAALARRSLLQTATLKR